MHQLLRFAPSGNQEQKPIADFPEFLSHHGIVTLDKAVRNSVEIVAKGRHRGPETVLDKSTHASGHILRKFDEKLTVLVRADVTEQSVSQRPIAPDRLRGAEDGNAGLGQFSALDDEVIGFNASEPRQGPDDNDAGKDAFVAARAMGKQLAEIRAWIKGSLDVKSKEQEPIWNVWCEKNLPFKRHQANRYIRVWNDGEELPFEGEITSVRAAIEVLAGRTPGGNNQETEKFKRVYGGGKHPTELIEAGPMGGFEGGSRSHRIRVTWCDDTLGKELSDMANGKGSVSLEGASQALNACAKLFGVALAVDDGKIADRLRRLMFDLWEKRNSKESVSLLLDRLEQATIAPPPNQQVPVGTGATGM